MPAGSCRVGPLMWCSYRRICMCHWRTFDVTELEEESRTSDLRPMAALLLALGCDALAAHSGARLSRREAVVAVGLLPSLSPLAAAAADPYDELRSRLAAPLVSQSATSPLGSRDEARLPAWMAGRWRCEQTLQAFTTPLGVQYIGAPGRPIAEAEASAAETRGQIGKRVALELRFDAVAGGAVEDRPFNARSRLDAFAGRKVVRDAQACAAAGVDAPGVSCAMVEFLGPVSQKQIVNWARVATPATSASPDAAPPPSSVIYSDFSRSIFARRLAPGDTRNFPPITTDAETIVYLAAEPAPADSSATATDVLRGRLRLISYLQPYDPLYFSAGGKSVSLSDYSLTLTRLKDADVAAVESAPPL